MARMIPAQEISAALPHLLREALSGPVEIMEGKELVAVVVSGPEYESLVQQRGRRALDALRELQGAVERSGATSDDLLQLERAVDRKAS